VQTDCNDTQLEFKGFRRRNVVADFDGGRITSDGGGILLLRELAERTGYLERFAACFIDHRAEHLIEHTVGELISQRVLGIALGYEDLNDHDTLRDDALFAVACGKRDPTGERRANVPGYRGHGLAGKSTLNRFELTPADASRLSRYKKIVCNHAKVESLFVDMFVGAHERPPKQIILDLDATDDPLHGKQEGRFFHGYYRCYCYLPLYIFCGDFLLCAKLRPSNIDGAAGALEELERIVAQIREAWPTTEIVIRADSGFTRDAIMAWCESEPNVEFVLGLARNERLKREVADEMEQARQLHEETGEPARVFKDFRYQTLKSWSCERRVVAKAEQLPDKENPRFVVTSLPLERVDACELYERVYCARGEMENRIKEQQLEMFADRTSTATIRANQLRLWFSSMAYVLTNELRRVGLRGTKMARAQCGTLRVRLFKVAALVVLSVRRVRVAISSVFPLKELYRRVLENIQRAYPAPNSS
jgi:Transposase DDE domain group 1